MNVLDIFSGIGGFSLGLERSGFKTVAFCEVDPFCQRILRKHWPKTPIYEDVRTLTANKLGTDGISVDVICGGFPCQDISYAGQGIGIAGKRSGLWTEYARLVSELRPRYVIVENVAALLGRGIDRVLGDLAEIGYDAEWHCIQAADIGAPHLRDRVWILSYPRRVIGTQPILSGLGLDEIKRVNEKKIWGKSGEFTEGVAERFKRMAAKVSRRGVVPQSLLVRIPSRVSVELDRLRSLGNSVVPQIPEIIGRAIMDSQKERAA